MNWLQKVFGHVKHAAVAVAHGFESLVGHDRAVEFAHASLGILNSAIGKIAAEAVHQVSSLDVPGAAKFSAASEIVLKAAADAGIKAEKDEIHTLIQLAVNVMNGRFQPVGNPPAQ